jgi:hypothetical protein
MSEAMSRAHRVNNNTYNRRKKMLSEVDIRDFDPQPVTPLYSVKPKSYIQLPTTGAVFYFDHLDGMYSYCLDMFGDTINLVAWIDVIPLVKKPE